MSKNKIDKLSGLVVITGASSGIGLELTKLAAADGCDLILASDTDHTEAVSAARGAGAGSIETVLCDLGSESGVDELMAKIGARQVDVLIANAGQGEGGAFLDQQWEEIARTIDTNVKGAVSLIHRIGKEMRERDHGRILVTGSIVGDIPGPFNLTYNSTKAFINDFCVGLANELKDTNVVVSCLLPGATDTEFFERADMGEDTNIGQADKADPAEVARDGYEALLKGETKEISGLLNKVQYLFADILPAGTLARMHRHMAQPKESEPAD